MKKIISVIFTIVLVISILIVYYNIDSITDYTIKFFTQMKKINIPKSNDYKREYEYERYIISDNYEPIDINTLENIYFNILNNGFDTFTFHCSKNYDTCIEDVKKISNDNDRISKINNYINPYNSFSSLNTSISEFGEVTLTIYNTYSEEEIFALDQIVNTIIKELNIESLSDVEKIRVLKDYLINNVSYDKDFVESEESFSTTAVGALIEKKAVCSGYSDAMALFLDKLDIPNIKISSENHIWNLLYIDGSWKHLDITWSDTDTEIDLKNKFFLLITDELLNIDTNEHTFDKDFYIEAN